MKASHLLFPLGLGLILASHALQALPDQTKDTRAEAARLVEWLLEEERDLTGIAFADVAKAVSGREVRPFDPNHEADQRVLNLISREAAALLREVNEPGHPAHDIPRINEVSGLLEDLLQERLDAAEGFSCTFPPTASGQAQRSGYPDLRLLDETSGRIYYLDPKVYAERLRNSTFRTFYFEPKRETNKILDDAAHLIIGLSHAGRLEDGRWRFTGWNLVDLSEFRVRLKAEFQGSNRDLYRDEAIAAEGGIEP